MAEIRVHLVDVPADGTWAMRDSSLTWRPPNRYGHTSTFDAFPAYPHDLVTVRAAVKHVQTRFPLLWDVDLYVANREEISRTNGHSAIHEDGHYEDGTWVKDPPSGMIMLGGKRVMPHPAMTRYLVVHETGHNVDYMINSLRGPRHISDCGELYAEYAQMRGLPETSLHHGDGGTWHDSCAEIMACDFRVVVCETETEFWPHPGVPRPGEVSGLVAWWAKAKAQITEAATAREKAATPAG